MQPVKKNYLDRLRLVAIFAVFFFHYIIPLPFLQVFHFIFENRRTIFGTPAFRSIVYIFLRAIPNLFHCQSAISQRKSVPPYLFDIYILHIAFD